MYLLANKKLFFFAVQEIFLVYSHMNLSVFSSFTKKLHNFFVVSLRFFYPHTQYFMVFCCLKKYFIIAMHEKFCSFYSYTNFRCFLPSYQNPTFFVVFFYLSWNIFWFLAIEQKVIFISGMHENFFGFFPNELQLFFAFSQNNPPFLISNKKY